ncbi:D-2-hydroxyacid dehydrogenase family protein [Bifidobacterium magnum]|uniref:D-3-phosphoglycerate dehydrogenase n=1 Tax=Bifidobacterium magnum TaxID=1692 RepID=A0A087BBA6_9BIFI|nr:D-2-hydroxyacid dehydrogenase family protein [Bifidobacterium magnum]KFI68306.1 D-3-phosphoglycerate dehydrogenase [Bifidobacterium magnum]
MTTIYETQQDRTDLPLVAMPCVMPGMIAPFKKNFALLNNIARVKMYEDFTFDDDEFVKRCEGASAVMAINFHISDKALEALAANHVKCIAFGGTGVQSYIDLPKAHALGIRVCNVRHYGNHAVAEFAVALMMELSRHVGELDHELREGEWDTAMKAETELYGRNLAIVGLGGIGQTVARIAQGFGMNVMAWKSPSSNKDYAAMDVTPVEDLNQLMAQADIVSLHLPLLPSTRGIITAENLAAMRPGTMFINTARAEIIEPGALEARLAKGDIPAALDVYDEEPLPMDSPLLKIPGLILTPHVAWRTDGAYASITEQVVRAIAAFFENKEFNVVE